MRQTKEFFFLSCLLDFTIDGKFHFLFSDNEGIDTVDFNGTLPTFEHGRANQWLGASIDVNENQGVVVSRSFFRRSLYE